MEFQQGQSYVGAPFPDTEWGERTALLTLASSAYVCFGEVLCRDVTQLSGEQSWANNQTGTGTTTQTTPSGYTPQPDMVVRGGSSNAGKPFGILVGAGQNNQPGFVTAASGLAKVDEGATGAPAAAGIFNNSAQANTFLVRVRWLGYTAGVWTKTTSATTIGVGDNLVATPGTTNDSSKGNFTGNKNIGIALASLSGGTLVSGVGSALLTTALSTTVYGQLNVDLNLV